MSAATAARCAADGRRRPVDPQLDPVVELEAGLAAQVLDRPGELAGVALGAQLGRQLGVEDHHEAVVLGDGRAGPRRGLDLDLVGGQRHARQRHRAVVVEFDGALAGRGHDRRDRRARAACRSSAAAA